MTTITAKEKKEAIISACKNLLSEENIDKLNSCLHFGTNGNKYYFDYTDKEFSKKGLWKYGDNYDEIDIIDKKEFLEALEYTINNSHRIDFTYYGVMIYASQLLEKSIGSEYGQRVIECKQITSFCIRRDCLALLGFSSTKDFLDHLVQQKKERMSAKKERAELNKIMKASTKRAKPKAQSFARAL